MRRGVLVFLLVLVALLFFAVSEVWNLLGLLIYDGHEDAIAKADLPVPGAEREYKGPRMIPKIIHQTTKNETIPEIWKEAHQSCRDIHTKETGWEHKLWTDALSLDFMRTEYPDFAPTFEAYKYPIQRADAIRYFVLYHYGGIYIDMDDGCARPLDPLLGYPAWVRKTVPTGISNDAMGSVPGHPFFRRVMHELKGYDRNWLMPYITVMGSTGPLFLSVLWRRYNSEGLNVGDGEEGGRLRILFPGEYQGSAWSFFTHHMGNSWHGADVEFIFWMARNWVFLTIFGFAVGGALIFASWWAYHRFVLKSHVNPGMSPVPKWKVSSIRSRFPFWRRTSARKEYELVSRHEV